MIFFMVMPFLTHVFTKEQFSYSTTKNGNGYNEKYTTHIIDNPYHNRKRIANLSKKARGVYIFSCKDGSCYVGSSVSLYSRVTSYFIPSILQSGNRRVLRYFRMHGFNNVTLTLHILHENSSITSLELEQYFIDALKPNLNVDISANSTGFHEPMSEYWRNYFRKVRGTGVYVYDLHKGKLVFISDSIQYLTDHVGIHRVTLPRYTSDLELFLGRFKFVQDYLPDLDNTNPLSLQDFKVLLENTRVLFDKSKVQPKSKQIIAENIKNPSLTKVYSSINSFAKSVGGDRGTIRQYLDHSSKLYRKQWKLTVIEKDTNLTLGIAGLYSNI